MPDQLTFVREKHPIRAYRDRRGLSMKQFANRAGVSLAGLSRIESCEFIPSLPVMLRLALACEGEVSEIDIFRYHVAAATGVVPRFRVPMTGCYGWDWVAPPANRESVPAAA